MARYPGEPIPDERQFVTRSGRSSPRLAAVQSVPKTTAWAEDARIDGFEVDSVVWFASLLTGSSGAAGEHETDRSSPLTRGGA
jgi:hypothetical protein